MHSLLSPLLLTLLAIVCAALAVIDIRTRTIPDVLNLAVALLGLIYAAQGGLDAVMPALLGGLFGAAIAWLVRFSYRRWRGFEGLGLGDVKLFGAAGLWVGALNLPYVVLIAAGTALAALGVQRLAGQKITAQTSLPFGPFIVVGLLVCLAEMVIS